ncbi:NADP(H)-dependent aldo-keto reductase [Microbaculum marinum]|uniref:Protein tas n=1 Tax=Microbaculum marinum TaxID=1764581 RepID=A0AAW9RZD0_9HYPH
MEYRRLGRTDLRVSAIGLGTMTWGEQNTEDEGHEQMDYALDHGINFFDAAELYPIPRSRDTQGRTEEYIGNWFKSRGTRDKVILASKIVGRSELDWFRDDGGTTDLSRAQVREAIDKSLTRLQTDYIDLYQVHWPDRAVSGFGSVPTIFKKTEGPEVPIEETLEALAEAVKAGKIRHVGLSNESPWGAMTYLRLSESKGLPRVQSIQNAYSLINRTFETGLAEIALREDLGLLAYSPLGQGTLTGKYLNGARPEGARRTVYNQMQRYEKPGTEEAVAAYVALAADAGLDPAQMALAFALSRPFVTSVLVGATSMEQLKTNIGAAEVDITAELEDRIDGIHLIRQNPCP